MSCAIWDNRILRVFLPLFIGKDSPVERQIRIARDLRTSRPSIRATTIQVLADAVHAESPELQLQHDTFNPSDPDVWIPPAFGVSSVSGDVFTLQFENLLGGRFQAVGLVNDWNLAKLDVAASNWNGG